MKRALLRECFSSINPFWLLSLIPFEIWQYIMNKLDVHSIVLLSQTCKGFNKLFEHLQMSDVSIATRFKRENQNAIGKKLRI